MFASGPKKYTTDTVSACIINALRSELQNSAPRDMTPKERDLYVQNEVDRYVFKEFVQGGTTVQLEPQCEPGKSLHVKAKEAQNWLNSQQAAGFFCVTLFIWSSNDAVGKACKKDLAWHHAGPVVPKGYRPLEQSPFYQNALAFKNLLIRSSHMVVMIGPGNSEIWKLEDGWDEASVKLCHALADPSTCQHSGEALFSCIETVDGWHARDSPENKALYGRYCLAALRTQLRAFEVRLYLKYCHSGMTEDEFRSDEKIRLEISRDAQLKFRFRNEATGRDVERMVSDVPEVN